MSRTEVLPLEGLRSGTAARRAGALLAATAVELGAAAAVSLGHASPARLVGVIVLGAAIFGLALRPRAGLLVVAGLWGVVHSILSETDLAFGLGGQTLTLSRALGAAIVVGVGWALLGIARGTPLPAPLKAASAFLVFYAFAAAVSPAGWAGIGDFVRVAAGICVGVAAYHVFDGEDRLVQLSRVVFLAGVVVAAVTIFQFALARMSSGLAAAIFGSSSYTYSYNADNTVAAVRVFGPLGGPGETAGFLVVAEAFGLLRYALLRERAGRFGGQVAGLVLIAAAILATLTRSSTAALVVLLLLWALQWQSQILSAVGARVKLLVLAAAIALAAVPLIGSQNLQARLWDLNPHTSGQSFAQGRGAIWSVDIARLESSGPAHVLLGHGAHTAYTTIMRSGLPAEASPHNLIVWLLLETGLVGAALYLWFLFGAGGSYLRAARTRRFQTPGRVGAVALATLVAYQVQGMFTLSPNNPGHGLYFMLFVGATLRACVDPGAEGG